MALKICLENTQYYSHNFGLQSYFGCLDSHLPFRVSFTIWKKSRLRILICIAVNHDQILRTGIITILSLPVQVFDVVPQLCSFFVCLFVFYKQILSIFLGLYFLCIGIEHLLWILCLNTRYIICDSIKTLFLFWSLVADI